MAPKVYDVVAGGDAGNVIVSPFSLHIAMSMVFFGSPTSSETHEELARDLTNMTFATEHPTLCRERGAASTMSQRFEMMFFKFR